MREDTIDQISDSSFPTDSLDEPSITGQIALRQLRLRTIEKYPDSVCNFTYEHSKLLLEIRELYAGLPEKDKENSVTSQSISSTAIHKDYEVLAKQVTNLLFDPQTQKFQASSSEAIKILSELSVSWARDKMLQRFRSPVFEEYLDFEIYVCPVCPCLDIDNVRKDAIYIYQDDQSKQWIYVAMSPRERESTLSGKLLNTESILSTLQIDLKGLKAPYLVPRKEALRMLRQGLSYLVIRGWMPTDKLLGRILIQQSAAYLRFVLWAYTVCLNKSQINLDSALRVLMNEINDLIYKHETEEVVQDFEKLSQYKIAASDFFNQVIKMLNLYVEKKSEWSILTIFYGGYNCKNDLFYRLITSILDPRRVSELITEVENKKDYYVRARDNYYQKIKTQVNPLLKKENKELGDRSTKLVVRLSKLTRTYESSMTIFRLKQLSLQQSNQVPISEKELSGYHKEESTSQERVVLPGNKPVEANQSCISKVGLLNGSDVHCNKLTSQDKSLSV